MKRKNILLVIFFIVAIGVIIINKYISKKNQRTNEEYIAILVDNKDDFRYVAETMKQYSFGYIDFANHPLGNQETYVDNRFITNNQEIANEMIENNKFYDRLLNLYNLHEISDILIGN